MTRFFTLLAAAAAAVVASPAVAQGGVQVIGGSLARSCYLAALANSSPSPADFRACEAALTAGRTTESDLVATHVNRGILFLRSGRIEAAVADFDRATALDPDQPEAYLNRGSALLKRREAQAAVTMFDQALQKRTRRPELAYYARAVAHEELGNVRAAHGDYLRAAQLAPKWEAPRLELTRFRVVNR
jgi:tetratricopeptide (TPR) repeat protein